jgi:hypothetical protein
VENPQIEIKTTGQSQPNLLEINTRAALGFGNWRFLANMFSKLLERVFFIDLPKFVGWQVI